VPLREDKLDLVRELLQACSAHIAGEDQPSRGSGFFIDERLLLTCAHVVKRDQAKVNVRPFSRASRPGRVVAFRGEEDLALVEVDPVAGEPPQPAVVLDRGMADSVEYYAVGYPREEAVGDEALEEIAYRGHRRQLDAASTSLLVLEAGQAAVTSGLSGGAVLNSTTGAVVALVQYSNDTVTDSGGAAIPIVRAVDVFEAVAARIADPPLATRSWRDALGPADWLALGKPSTWHRQLDLVINGNGSCWRVAVYPDEYEVTVRDLPDAVSEALFSWAQRRRLSGVDEVKLVGHLLSSAVFPTLVAERLGRESRADEVLVRLHVEPDSPLFNVPWEFAKLSLGGQDKYVAADRGLGLVRVVDHPTPAEVDTAPCPGRAEVLGIVIDPEEWTTQMPTPQLSGTPVQWPVQGRIMADLQSKVRAPLGFQALENPNATEIINAVSAPRADSSIEVVHYIGFGKVENGVPNIALHDDDMGVVWREAKEFFGWVADSGARLLVVEFALLPLNMDVEGLPLGAFVDAISERVNAVACTRFPVHPRQLPPFNDSFYAALGSGESVEVSVQRARYQLQQNRPLGDAAGFGWFPLITGPRSYMQIVPSTAGDQAARETKQEEPRREEPAAPAEAPPPSDSLVGRGTA
jgi:hypothetical protein